MGGLDIRRVEWSKSSYSSANGQCIQVARNLPGVVAVRGFQEPGWARADLLTADWRTFVSRVKGRDFGQ
jgi:hypothetical protein